MSDAKSDKFYGVAHGRKPGVYENWSDVQEQIQGFPQPVYKKFHSKNEAETYVKERQPEQTLMDVDESADKFYAVARGKVNGIFTSYEEVKKHIANYPQPMYKKFNNIADAKSYFKKYTKGEDDSGNFSKFFFNISHYFCFEAKSGQKATKAKNEGKKIDDKEKECNSVFYAVARGHKKGVFSTWAECQEQTKDFKGAKFKKFDNEEDAKMFAEGKTLKQIEDRKRKHEKANGDEACEAETAKQQKLKE
ncbi:unnamed protein product [Dracunculus medinensis]|uniref:ribonuclease H n=1 Tax=Dracunculus medinensis TaxID=318479 RepID=A0A0N4UAT5_DRAME|nr:unnamed protein product [Dracunculus medinensis]